jgi:hypothetical protein
MPGWPFAGVWATLPSAILSPRVFAYFAGCLAITRSLILL